MGLAGRFRRRQSLEAGGEIGPVETIARAGGIDGVGGHGGDEQFLAVPGNQCRLRPVLDDDFLDAQRGDAFRAGLHVPILEQRLLVGEGGERNIGDAHGFADRLLRRLAVRP